LRHNYVIWLEEQRNITKLCDQDSWYMDQISTVGLPNIKKKCHQLNPDVWYLNPFTLLLMKIVFNSVLNVMCL
jgi:hypothetical protein